MSNEPTGKRSEDRVEGQKGLDRLAALTRRLLKAPKPAARPKGGSRSKSRKPQRGRSG